MPMPEIPEAKSTILSTTHGAAGAPMHIEAVNDTSSAGHLLAVHFHLRVP